MNYYFNGDKVALESLIAQAVRKALNVDSRPAAVPPTPAKVLLSESSPAPILIAVCCSDCLNQPVKDQFKLIEEKQIKIQIEEAEEWDDSVDLMQLISAPQITLFPALSENAIAKMANGIFDEPLSRLLLEAIQQAKPFYAIAPEVSADLRKNSPTLFRLRQSHRQKLEQFGVRWITQKDISKVLLSALPKSTFTDASSPRTSGQKQLITASDIETAARAGKRKLQLPYKSIITPLAKDRARDLDVVIELTG